MKISTVCLDKIQILSVFIASLSCTSIADPQQPILTLENGASVYNTPTSGGVIQVNLGSGSSSNNDDFIPSETGVKVEVDITKLQDITANSIDIDLGDGVGPMTLLRETSYDHHHGGETPGSGDTRRKRRKLRRIQEFEPEIKEDALSDVVEGFEFDNHNDVLPPNDFFSDDSPTQHFQYFEGVGTYQGAEATAYIKFVTMVLENGMEVKVMSGYVVTSDMDYVLSADPQTGKTYMTQMNPDDYPTMPSPLEPDGPEEPYGEGAVTMDGRKLVGNHVVEGSTVTLANGMRARVRRRTQSDDGSVLDILVAYTKNAMCQANGAQSSNSYDCDDINPAQHVNIINIAEEAVTNTNQAYVNSGIETQLRLVYVHYASGVDDRAYSCSGILGAVTKADGIMDEVRDKRNEWGADFVALLTSTAVSGCGGIAWLGPYNSYMYSVTLAPYARGGTFAHEVGHNYGCEHDRLNASPGKPFQYGWQDPEAEFRTIMAYTCPNRTSQNRCGRINYFSNPTKRHNGKIMGNALNDCARQHNEVKNRVALYRNVRITNAPTSSVAPSVSSSPSVAPTKLPTASPTGSREPTSNPSLSLEPSSTPSEFPTFSMAGLDSYYKLESPRSTSFQVQHGIMFDIKAKNYDVTIHNFRIPFLRGGDVTISVWSIEGSFWYEKNNPAAWDLLGSPLAYSPGITLESPVPLPFRSGLEYGFEPVVIPAGTTKGIFIVVNETTPNVNLIGMNRKIGTSCAIASQEPFNFPIAFENDDLSVFDGVYKDTWLSSVGSSQQPYGFIGTVFYESTKPPSLTLAPTASPAPSVSVVPSLSLQPTISDYLEVPSPAGLSVNAIDGIMIEATAKSQNILIKSLKLTIFSVSPEYANDLVELAVYSSPDSFYDETLGDSIDKGLWTFKGSTSVTAASSLEAVILPENSFDPIFVEKGSTIGVFVTMKDSKRNHKILSNIGTILKGNDFENTDLLVKQGLAMQWDSCSDWGISLKDTNGSPYPHGLRGSLLYSLEGTSIPTSTPSLLPSAMPSISLQPSLSLAPSSGPTLSVFPSKFPSSKPSISLEPTTSPTVSGKPTYERKFLKTRSSEDGNSAYGLMFDVVSAGGPLQIHSITLSQMQSYPMNIKIYSKPGTHYYAYDDITQWEEIQSFTNFTADPYSDSKLSFPFQLVTAGSTRAFYIAIVETYGEVWPLMGGVLAGTNYRGVWANDTKLILLEGIKFYGINDEHPFGLGTPESGPYLLESPGATSFNMKDGIIEYSEITTIMPSSSPSESFAPSLSTVPSAQPSASFSPSSSPSVSLQPSKEPSVSPTQSDVPTQTPSHSPSMSPSTSSLPTLVPSLSTEPTSQPSSQPTSEPSSMPSDAPSVSSQPSATPSEVPSALPTLSFSPSMQPSLSLAPSLERSRLQSTSSGTVSGAFGIMFDVIPKRAIMVNAFDVDHFGGSSFEFHVYTKPGSWAVSGASSDSRKWTKIGSVTVGSSNPSKIPSKDIDPIPVYTGQTQAFYIACIGNYFKVRQSDATDVSENDEVVLTAGHKKYPYDDLFSSSGGASFLFQGDLIYSYAVEPPSASPSFVPSLNPSLSLSPTKTGTKPPTSSPTASQAPSVITEAPSTSLGPSVDPFTKPRIEITVPASITLSGFNIPSSNVQLATVITVMADTIASAASVNLNTSQRVVGVRIISINGQLVDTTTTLRDRLLAASRILEATVVDYELILESICSTNTCDDSQEVANALYNAVTTSMQEQIASGEFATDLAQNAADAGSDADALLAAAVDSGDFSAVVTSLLGLLSEFYPDWIGGGYCLNDGNEPLYMTNNPSAWLYSSRDACCQRYYKWSYTACMGNSIAPSRKWFVDHQKKICVQDCIEDSGDPTCGGLAESHSQLFDDAVTCCSAKLSWRSSPVCVSESTLTPLVGTNKWFVDYVDYVCKQDCDEGEGFPCGGINEDAYKTLYDSALLCCKSKLGWLDIDSCESYSTTGSGPTGSSMWYVDAVLQQCVQDCEDGATCGGLAHSWDAKYSTSAECCSQRLWWLRTSDCTP